MKDFNKQYPSERYNNYDDKGKWELYFIEKELVIKYVEKPSNILEIGIGNKFLSDYLKKKGYKLTTCDFNKNLNPDIISDIRDMSKIKAKYEMILAFEVLEHFPFGDLDKALKEVSRLLNDNGIFIIEVPKVPLPLSMKVLYNNQHYWELGKLGHSKRRFNKHLKRFFNILESFNTRTERFYVMKKRFNTSIPTKENKE